MPVLMLLYVLQVKDGVTSVFLYLLKYVVLLEYDIFDI